MVYSDLVYLVELKGDLYNNCILRPCLLMHLGTSGSSLSPFQPLHYGIFNLFPRDLDPVHHRCLAPRYLQPSFLSAPLLQSMSLLLWLIGDL